MFILLLFFWIIFLFFTYFNFFHFLQSRLHNQFHPNLLRMRLRMPTSCKMRSVRVRPRISTVQLWWRRLRYGMVLEECQRRVLRPKRMPKPGWRHHRKEKTSNVVHVYVWIVATLLEHDLLLLLLPLLQVARQREERNSANRQWLDVKYMSENCDIVGR